MADIGWLTGHQSKHKPLTSGFVLEVVIFNAYPDF